jgi:hypothetical protein
MNYIVEPTGGLCNYLRVVFSYWLFCKKEGQSLTVIWKETNECPGFFLDYFEPLECVLFLKDNKDCLPVNFKGDRWHPTYNPYAMFIYNGLIPLQNIQEKINANKEALGSYIAVHIRRTDHIWLAQVEHHYTDDDAFIKFINEYPDNNIYISTDNRETQDKFYSLFPTRILIIDLITPSASLRQTTIEKAIIDIFTCTRSSHFKASGFSSFSATISQLREPVKADGYYVNHISY